MVLLTARSLAAPATLPATNVIVPAPVVETTPVIERSPSTV
jgi:hypothetical protein